MQEYLDAAKRRAKSCKASCFFLLFMALVFIILGFLMLLDYEEEAFFYLAAFSASCAIVGSVFLCSWLRSRQSCNMAEASISKDTDSPSCVGELVLGENTAYIARRYIFIVYDKIKWIEVRGNRIHFWGRTPMYNLQANKYGCLSVKTKYLLQEEYSALCRKISEKYPDVLIGYSPQMQAKYNDYIRKWARDQQTPNVLSDDGHGTPPYTGSKDNVRYDVYFIN